MQKQIIIQTENILFKYFRHIKIHKYLLRDSTPTQNINDYWMVDISNILNNCNLDSYEQDIVVMFGNRLHRPKYNCRVRFLWDSAISKISSDFIKKGIINDIK